MIYADHTSLQNQASDHHLLLPADTEPIYYATPKIFNQLKPTDMQQKLPYEVTTSFTVSSNDLNSRANLQLCRVLTVANKHNDDAIYAMLGSLDYSQVGVTHYDLDIIGTALLNDVVTINTQVWYSGNQLIEILLEASIDNSNNKKVIVNGSFVFTVKNAALGYQLAA